MDDYLTYFKKMYINVCSKIKFFNENIPMFKTVQ